MSLKVRRKKPTLKYSTYSCRKTRVRPVSCGRVFCPRKLYYYGSIHSLTLAQSCTRFYSLSLSFCVCFFRKENTREYGAPSPKHCVTTSQRGEQILLSHLWTSGKSVHAGNVCTVLMLELRKEYRTYLETNAFVEDTKFCQNWKVNWVTWV